MPGAFYGSLAASASVFVAILTALLVNDYVRIKSDRRQLEHQLNRVNGKINGLEEERDTYQAIVDEIWENWEEDFRETAEERVEDFKENHVGTDYSKPIEKLTLDEVYWELAQYHDFETPDEMEGEARKHHHKNVLEEEWDEIQQLVGFHFTRDFAEEYRGRGWEQDNDGRSLEEVFDEDELLDESDIEDMADETDGDEADFSDLLVQAGGDLHEDLLDFDGFVEEYKEEHRLDEVEDLTTVLLEHHYNEIVDSPPMETLQDVLGDFNDFTGLGSSLAGLEAIGPIPSDAEITVSGMRSISEQRRHDEARDRVSELDSRIGALEDEKESIENQLQRLDPSDLKDALVANVLTILFSVVIPMVVFLLTIIDVSLGGPAWLSTFEVVTVFGFWLMGLLIVFEWIYARIRDQDPKMYAVYNLISNGVSSVIPKSKSNKASTTEDP